MASRKVYVIWGEHGELMSSWGRRRLAEREARRLAILYGWRYTIKHGDNAVTLVRPGKYQSRPITEKLD